jgi:hypothetical protein
MNIGGFMCVEVFEPVDHRLLLLRGRGIIQPDERSTVDLFPKDRENPSE